MNYLKREYQQLWRVELMRVYKSNRCLEIVSENNNSMMCFYLHKFYCGTKERITSIGIMIKGKLITFEIKYTDWNKETL